MRVIAGDCKSRVLKAVPGKNTRPTTDKIKEALFSIIGPFFEGEEVLDLFAGSGGLGIEALSRGAKTAVFIDQSSLAIKTIHENLTTCKLTEQAEVFRNEAFRALKIFAKQERCFDLIFLDPPYKKQQLETIISQLDTLEMVRPGSQIICEHDKEATLPKNLGRLTKIREATYGITILSIYRLEEGLQ
ncbi:16S rRNA (guanine(966)-N(2))-methyltransferase RsmD [Listeria sp. PSOL-1]|uniref:16S rRNA (guanine(966)-N(2))-methyltransferase RsmD n=1 Tax=Listeria sp. PSOL-1 TaxID=1844999 RepID=UPI0013D0D84D|nr:16S rRNA (guanine(966)-N(2))-methyltransferase RsmD [Listeria sp. PSOL-1]